jgi:hypothetical protein
LERVAKQRRHRVGHGGPISTLALLPGSPALAAGSKPLAEFDGVPLPYDQRGPSYSRAKGDTVDIGACEDQGDRLFGKGFE